MALLFLNFLVTHSILILNPLYKFSMLQAGDSSAEELATATQVQGQYMPIIMEKPTVELVKVTEEMKSFKAYGKLRVERMNQRHVGARLKKAAEAEKEEKK